MFCPHCGSQIPDTSKFCENCGSPVSFAEAASSRPTEANTMPGIGQMPLNEKPVTSQPAEEKPKRKRKPTAKKMMQDGSKVSENIYFCDDGKYRWIYEMSLFKNPTIFILVWKILFFIILGIFAFTLVMDAVSGDLDGERFLQTMKFLGYFLIGMTVVTILGYLLYAAIMGGKYIVVFEMDDRGVNHKQMPKQAKKAELIGLLTALAGVAAKNPTTVGVGLNSTRTEMYTEFERVRKVKAYPKRNLIKINQRLSHNQVYAEKEDYDFVYEFIMTHVDFNKIEK